MTPSKKPDRFPCPGCSGDMEFDPQTGGMKCPFCGHTEAMPAPAATPAGKHSLDAALAKGGAVLEKVSPQALEVTCSGCGAVVVFDPPQVAGNCSFCGADLVAQPKAADPLIAPDAVLPAKVPKDKAQAEVKQWLQSRWFAPNALKRMARQEGIAGVYLPFWDYDAATVSQYRGERGQHYWENETYEEDDGRGGRVQRTRQVQRTAWYPAAGEVSREFEDVLIAASTSVSEHRLNALQPWDLESLCPYEPAYLSGFKAQRYQVELPGGFEKAKSVMASQIEQDVRRAIGGDEQQIQSVDTQYSAVVFRHLLLPVWIGAYRFQSRAFQVVVNARTGEVQGERPYSAAKIMLLVLVILFVIGILVLLGKH
jgi:ribosomal protein S27E